MLRARSKSDGFSCFSFQGSALALFKAGRDLVHDGWQLLHHPLYGNFRPYQQPYRSLLLKFNPASLIDEGGITRINADGQSLHYLEEALALFQGVRVLEPSEAPESYLADCSFLEYELMRLPLEQSGWPINR